MCATDRLREITTHLMGHDTPRIHDCLNVSIIETFALASARTYAPTVLAPQIADAVTRKILADAAHDVPGLRRELHVSMGEGRIDVAAVNGRLVGYEIKSAADSFARLPRQIDVYGRVVDEAVLVVERRRPDALLERIPWWWGLWSARSDGEGCTLEVVRAPAANPTPQALATAQLLWRDEALALLREHRSVNGLARANRWRLWTLITDVVPLPELQRYVRAALRARPGW